MRTGSAQFWTDRTDRTSHATEEGPDGCLIGGDASLSEAAASAAEERSSKASSAGKTPTLEVHA